MVDKTDSMAAQSLSLPEELILMLLNQETGYFHHVPGWELHCAVVGAVLAELSLLSRIDTDLNSLILQDSTKTGDPSLDPILNEIASGPVKKNAQYWIERLSPHAESIIDLTLNKLVKLKILKHHDGEFWTLNPTVKFHDSKKGTAGQFIKMRIREVIFTDTIPDPRDIIIVCLVNTCDVFRFIFELDDEAVERIKYICRMDLIGRSIADAVEHNISGPLIQRSLLKKEIPRVALRHLLFNKNLRGGNIPAFFADLTKRYGPVFKICLPFTKPKIFLSGPEANRWTHRQGRLHLRVRDYFSEFEKVYGASGVLPSLDGGDHFRLRRSLAPAYSRKRLEGQVDRVYQYIRKFMADWTVGHSYQATRMCRYMINSQLSPLTVGFDTQDIFEDISTYKERALTTHIIGLLPKFMLHTPSMKRRTKAIDTLLERVQLSHTPTQRVNRPRDLADDLLSLHGSDPQLVPESNFRFALSAALLASVYLGDALSLAVYAMASRPDIYEKIRNEADALFSKGDPKSEDFTPSAISDTHSFLRECLRMYPIVPMSMRDVMNSCIVEGFELPIGSRVHIAQTATHYMEEIFPNPFSFDIDRYRSPRNEHRHIGYAPYGLGTHKCLGSQWVDLQMSINVLMIAHYFTLEVAPTNYKLRLDPIPSIKPCKRLKFRIAEQRRELPI